MSFKFSLFINKENFTNLLVYGCNGTGKYMFGNESSEYATDDIYNGEFKDGEFNGNGVLTEANGSVYTGQFKDDLFSGYGVFVSNVSEYTYEGNWLLGKKHGF